jgi:hypothetical protein
MPTRLSLARWLTSRDNPLTARVAVNRMWQQFFSRGVVTTSEDFGAHGDNPTHPALLDWLAVEFMDRHWDVKVMHKLIVTSATYRQSSIERKDLLERDPDNKLLARQSRFRLHAELIRDVTLAASGLLNTAIGGKSIRPYLPTGVRISQEAQRVRIDALRDLNQIHYRKTAVRKSFPGSHPTSWRSRCSWQRLSFWISRKNLPLRWKCRHSQRLDEAC